MNQNAIPSSTLMSTFESGLKAIQAMFFRFSKGKVYDLLLLTHRIGISTVNSDWRVDSATYLTRSKAECLFPTGLNTVLLSDVKTMLPCL